jgi:NADPH-dependent curcumin reductase CurA
MLISDIAIAVAAHVRGDFSWQDYVVTDGKGFGGMQKVAPGRPPNLALSLFGVNGLTSYFGMIEIGKIKVGETVVVSGAAIGGLLKALV